MASTLTMPTNEQAWEWLNAVPDPELVDISVTELGIVRSVDCSKNPVVVKITPTYSGCPATSMINQTIAEAFTSRGIPVDVQIVISPAWTTDWMQESAFEKLRAMGITPPSGVTCSGMLKQGGKPIECPRCNSKDTNNISQFGSTPCKASYRCNSCLEPFEYFKSF